MSAPSTSVLPQLAGGSSRAFALSTSEKWSGTDQLGERIASLMAADWRRGERLLAEDYLIRHPELSRRPQAAMRVIYEELCLRQDNGEHVSLSEMETRFPQWQAELKMLLDCHQLVETREVAVFPKTGELLGGFQLLAEIERGAFGRVYLASEPALGDRTVVLKITPCDDGREHLSLARLQHTHIVPLFSVQHFPARNLRVLCMPYLGGTTLAHVLYQLRDRPPAQRTGQQILDSLDSSPTNRLLPFPSQPFPFQGPARQFMAKASYVQAIGWIGACLADALRYAHERGLVHLDVKPGNVLMAADAQPMLLDFHLAREPISADGTRLDWIGGTHEYMSPEQEAALKAVKRSQPIPSAVDGRADIYSLGLVLYESLAGFLPVGEALIPHLLPRLSKCNPQVSVGLSDLVHKCLDPDPGARYGDAAALAGDLRRHLADLPLRGVTNRSVSERWHKWRRRRPHMLAGIGMVLTATAAIFAGAALVANRHAEEDRQRLAFQIQGEDFLGKGQYDNAAEHLNRALTHARSSLANTNLQAEIASRLQLAQRGQAAERLHLLAEQLRFQAGAEWLPPGATQTIEKSCGEIWEHRSQLVDQTLGRLDAIVEDRLRTDLLDVAILWADVRVRSASPPHVNEARREALTLLSEAEQLLRPSAALYRERQDLAEALGLKDEARNAAAGAKLLPPSTAWDRVAFGRRLLRQGQAFLASTELHKAVDLEPRNFWANFYQGLSAYRLRQYPDAIAAFRVCISLAPDCAECYYNRGRTLAALGRHDQAIRDYDHALRLKPVLAEASLNRGILHYRERRYPEAATDLGRAIEHGADPATAYYNAALVELARDKRPAALSHLDLALKANPAHKESLELHERLRR